MRHQQRHPLKAVLTCALAGALLLGLGASSVGAAEPTATPGERVRALVEPSIVYLRTEFTGLVYDNVSKSNVRDEKFTRTSFCSGFFVSPQGDVMTAAHCVESTQSVKDDLRLAAADWAIERGLYGDVQPTAENVGKVAAGYGVRGLQRNVVVAYGVSASADTQSGTARRAVVKGIRSASQEAGDVAIVKMLNVRDVPALKIAGDAPVETLEDVWSVGYPAKVDYAVDDTFAPSFKDGSISSQKTQDDVPVYELSSGMAPGMSGGPTVDAEGNVIGVNSFIALDDDRTRSEAFTFVQTAETANDLVADKNINNDFGETNTIYREGIEAYFDGDKGTSTDRLEEVITRVPNHALAREYLTKAEALPEDSSGMPGWAWVLIALAVIAATAGGVYALLRSGRFKSARSTKPAVEPSGSTPAPVRGRTTISPRPGEPSLVIHQGPGAGQRFAIKSDMLLGREEADINLDDPEVSRRHAMVRRVNGTLEISDLRSANGTRINGSPIDGPRSVSDGDTIELGQTTLTVELPAGRGVSETATHRHPEDR
jgi:S1-C subfamily serine protease